MSEVFILVPGRTSKQGCGISEGKFTDGYQKQISTVQMNPADMEKTAINDGDRVRLESEFGATEVTVVKAKADELPEGLLFMAYGDHSSRLMGGDTHGSGMPTSKGIDVTITRVATQGEQPVE